MADPLKRCEWISPDTCRNKFTKDVGEVTQCPAGLTPPSPIKQLAGRYYHSCVVLADGITQCWGYNGYGQLGDDTDSNSAVPVTVQNLTGTVGVATEYYDTCAIIQDGSVKMLGI